MASLQPMEWSVLYQDGPEIYDFQKLGEYANKRVNENQPFIFLQHCLGTAFKLRKVPDADDRIVYQTCTRHAAETLGSAHVIIRPIVPKLIQLEMRGSEGILKLQVKGSLSGDDLCYA